jgi:hypothetical protein
MEKEMVLSFKTIKKMGDYGVTIGYIKKRAEEVKNINDINFAQRMADSNITKLFNKNQMLPGELQEQEIKRIMRSNNIW